MNENNEIDIVDTEQPVEDDNSVVEASPVDSIPILEYTEDNPLPVYIVPSEETEEVEEQLEVFSATGSYSGIISDTYLNYFTGIVEKLGYDEHYVIWRSGQYSYSLAYGSDLDCSDGGVFNGKCTVVSVYRDSSSYSSDWYVSTSSDSVSVSADSLFLYSDLGMYPTVERGLNRYESQALLFGVAVAFLFGVVSILFSTLKR